jgi:Flp pilus assembly pilin Flp
MDEREVLDRLPHWEAESGQTMVEYGFVVMAVALIAIAAFQAFGGRVSAMVNTIQW